MMSCGICSRWQHIQCHDRADRMANRPRRNWNSEEFICCRCRATRRVLSNSCHPTSKQVPVQNVQNHFARPNGQQYPNRQCPSNLAATSIFSHYQPSQHAFLPSTPNTPHPNVQSLYPHSNSSYNAFQHQHRHHISSQTSWNPNAPQSVNPMHSNAATTLPISSCMPSQTDNYSLQTVHTYSNVPQTSYTRLSRGHKQPLPY